MSKATPRINPQEYKTKAEAVLDMLKKGLSVKQIKTIWQSAKATST
jgi:hypothetical protein